MNLETCTIVFFFGHARHLLQLRHHGAIIIRNIIAASILVLVKTQNHELWIWKPSSISTLDLKTQINFISLGLKPLIFETPKPKLHLLVDLNCKLGGVRFLGNQRPRFGGWLSRDTNFHNQVHPYDMQTHCKFSLTRQTPLKFLSRTHIKERQIERKY